MEPWAVQNRYGHSKMHTPRPQVQKSHYYERMLEKLGEHLMNLLNVLLIKTIIQQMRTLYDYALWGQYQIIHLIAKPLG